MAFHSSIQILGPLLTPSGSSPACLSLRGEEGLLRLKTVRERNGECWKFPLPHAPAGVNFTDQAGTSSHVLPVLTGLLGAFAAGV